MSRLTNNAIRLGIFSLLINLFAGGNIMAQENAEWPCFHGPDRSNKSIETGLLDEWADGGPELQWSVAGLGSGYSTVSIAEGRIFTAGIVNGQTYVFAYDLDGKLEWKKPNGNAWETDKSWATSYGGARSTPTFNDGVIYHLGELGRLAAFNSKSGDELWSLELREAFQAEIPEYGYSESVLIEGDKLYCCPAGKKGFIVCLNKNNGNLIWTNSEISGSVGFNSLVIFNHGGKRQISGMSSNSIYGVDLETGEFLWLVDYENSRSNNVSDPIFHKGYLFASSGYGKGSILIELPDSESGNSPNTVWHSELMDSHHGGVILHDGHLYGAGHNSRGLFCLDFMTGEQKWKAGGKGSITYAEDKLFFLDERGIMTLVKAEPEKHEVSGSFKVPDGGEGMHWAHPVVCGGRLYVRHQDKLFAYDVRK